MNVPANNNKRTQSFQAFAIFLPQWSSSSLRRDVLDPLGVFFLKALIGQEVKP